MRRVAFVLTLVACLLLSSPAASAQTGGVLDEAASHLRAQPVYVDPDAERAANVSADALARRVRQSGAAIFLAVLPSSATQEVGGDANRLPRELGNRVNLSGTYGVVAGNSFRAASSTLSSGRAGQLATAAFQANRDRGTEAVLADFVDRVAAASAPTSPGGGADRTPASGPFAGGDSERGGGDGGGVNLLPVLLLLGAGGIGLYAWSRRKRQREEAEQQASEQRDRNLIEAELSVLADDILAVEPQLSLHPEARADYDAAVSRYRVAQAALAHADDPIDLVRVSRVVDEARYAMSRARALVEGREPPPPPAELTRPGRRGEPPIDLDERGEPAYVGSGAPFYGGGWFGGGGGGLLTGLFLGQMLGGGWGWGGHDTNVYVDNDAGDAGSDGGDWGGGDFGGGDFGGGDFGGGDFGGGDFGGDVGGGDW